MSNLSDKLEEIKKVPTLTVNLRTYFNGLSESDRDAAWRALQNENVRSYPLLEIFRSYGLKSSKDTFVPFRKKILAGELTKEEVFNG